MRGGREVLLGLAATLAVPACRPARAAAPADPPAPRVVISLVGTNDLHGHIEALPVLGGYLANLRRARARDGGAVVLVDAGDMLHGTLESNLGEGAGVVRAMNALRYDAAAIGNHEFDFGPAGDAPFPRGPADDPRGALKARAAEARFPFLSANIRDAATGAALGWPNVRPSTVVEAAGVRIGIVGAATTATPRATMPANFAGLTVAPIAASVAEAGRALRASGATVVVLVTHAGGECRALDDPDELSSCVAGSEVFRVAEALARRTRAAAGADAAVDAIVAGHTHDGIAQRVAGIPIIESFAAGAAFGRVDLTVERKTGRVVGTRIFPPRWLCKPDRCAKESYEGAPVLPDRAVAGAIAPDLARARALRERPVGVTVTRTVVRAYRTESALGNLFADLMREARPGADVALTNGGGLRADLSAGALTYGGLFEAAPFDNRLVVLPVTGQDLERLVARNLGRSGAILSLSGMRARARCGSGRLAVELRRPDGRPIAPADKLTLVISDYLASGGDGLVPEHLRRDVRLGEGEIVRDEMARVLRARGGALDGGDPALYDPAHPRLDYARARPVKCGRDDDGRDDVAADVAANVAPNVAATPRRPPPPIPAAAGPRRPGAPPPGPGR